MRNIPVLPLLLFFGLMLFSCDEKFEFYYYPAKNVYYDVRNSRYLYSLDGGETWDSMYAKANTEPATLGSKQIIYSATPDIWTANKEHLQQYNGKAIIVTNNDSIAQSDLAADRKIKRKPPVVNTSKKAEKKAGFFKRIFGKKNKD